MKPETQALLTYFKAACHNLPPDQLVYYGTQVDYAEGPIIAAARGLIEADLLSGKLTGKYANLTTIKRAIAQAERDARAMATGESGCARCSWRGHIPVLCTFDRSWARHDWAACTAPNGGPALIYEVVARCRCGCSPNIQIPIVSTEQLDGYERLYEPYLGDDGSPARAWNCACRQMLIEGGFRESAEFKRLNRLARTVRWALAERGQDGPEKGVEHDA